MEHLGSQLATNGLYIGCRNGQALLSQNHGTKSESVQVATIDIYPFCHSVAQRSGSGLDEFSVHYGLGAMSSAFYISCQVLCHGSLLS